MLAELLTFNSYALIVILARVGAVLTLMPGISASYVSMCIRMMLALGLSFLLMPLLAARLPALPAAPLDLGLLLIGEVIVGVFLGTVARVIVAALHAAGTFISYVMSLANAMAQDPVAETQSSTVAGFFSTIGVLLVFVTDLHHLMLKAIVASYELFPAGAPLPVGDFAETLGRGLAESFLLGLQMAAPFVLLGFTYTLGLGLLGRLMPQLSVFFFGLPFQIAVQIWLMTLVLSAVMLAFVGKFAETMGKFAGL